jgi:hypothetical protein
VIHLLLTRRSRGLSPQLFSGKSCKKLLAPSLGDPLEVRQGNEISRAARFLNFILLPVFAQRVTPPAGLALKHLIFKER